MATLAAPRVTGLQARSAQKKTDGLRGFVTGARSAYSRFREKGAIGGRGRLGRGLKRAWESSAGGVVRAGLRSVPGVSQYAGLAGSALFGKAASRRGGQTVSVRDPASGKTITRRFESGRVRGTKQVRKLGQAGAGALMQRLAQRSPERATKFFGKKVGQFAGTAAVAGGGALAVGALRKLRAWQRAPKLRERTLKEFKRSPEAARIYSKQRESLQRRNAPIQQANRASRQRQVQSGQRRFAAREQTITPRGYKPTGRRPTITRGYQRQLGRVAPTTIRQRGAVRRYAGGSTAAVSPYRGAARVSTYRPSTSKAAVSQRGRTRYTRSGSTYVSKSGRGGLSISPGLGSTSRSYQAMGQRASYRAKRPASTRPTYSTPKRSYAEFRRGVKVS